MNSFSSQALQYRDTLKFILNDYSYDKLKRLDKTLFIRYNAQGILLTLIRSILSGDDKLLQFALSRREYIEHKVIIKEMNKEEILNALKTYCNKQSNKENYIYAMLTIYSMACIKDLDIIFEKGGNNMNIDNIEELITLRRNIELRGDTVYTDGDSYVVNNVKMNKVDAIRVMCNMKATCALSPDKKTIYLITNDFDIKSYRYDRDNMCLINIIHKQTSISKSKRIL